MTHPANGIKTHNIINIKRIPMWDPLQITEARWGLTLAIIRTWSKLLQFQAVIMDREVRTRTISQSLLLARPATTAKVSIQANTTKTQAQ